MFHNPAASILHATGMDAALGQLTKSLSLQCICRTHSASPHLSQHHHSAHPQVQARPAPLLLPLLQHINHVLSDAHTQPHMPHGSPTQSKPQQTVSPANTHLSPWGPRPRHTPHQGVCPRWSAWSNSCTHSLRADIFSRAWSICLQT